MYHPLIGCLKHYAQTRQHEVNRGLYSGEFATTLIQAYTYSMIKGLKIIGKPGPIPDILSESEQLCRQIDCHYQPRLRVVPQTREPISITNTLTISPHHHHKDERVIRSGTLGW